MPANAQALLLLFKNPFEQFMKAIKQVSEISSRVGFTFVEMMIVVTVIGLLAAIAIPNWMIARSNARTKTCLGNLTKINSAIEQWTLENGKSIGDDIDTSASGLAAFLGRVGDGSDVFCPIAGHGSAFNGYTITTVGTSPQCSHFDAAQHNAALP